jgi:hypothetical protein
LCGCHYITSHFYWLQVLFRLTRMNIKAMEVSGTLMLSRCPVLN